MDEKKTVSFINFFFKRANVTGHSNIKKSRRETKIVFIFRESFLRIDFF